MGKYYCRSKRGESGPFSRDELLFLLRSGAVPGEIHIRHEMDAPWLPVDRTEFAIAIESPLGTKEAISTGSSDGSGALHSVTTTPSTDHPESKQQTTLQPKFRPSIDTRNQWIANLVVAAIVVLVLLIGIWLRTRSAAIADRGDSLPSFADSTATGSDTPVTTPTAEGSASNMDSSPTEETPEKSEDTPVLTPREIELESPPDPDEEPVAKAPTDPEKSFRIRLPNKEELRASAASDGALPEHDPVLRRSFLSGRHGPQKSEAIRKGGGTPDSEAAVALALGWLKRIQQSDGSWRFDRVGSGAQPGTLQSPAGATALAMLCFLGAGNTTSSGPDMKVVEQAFRFLESSTERHGWQTDTMYVHAIVMMSFSELAAMDPANTKAKQHAESLLAFIERAQDPRGGGWRYSPGDPGDLSVTGWQVMALQSGRTCKLKVNNDVVAKTFEFLDSVSRNGGSEYCYTPASGSSDCMTAVGLLSRMYLGWPRNARPLQKGLREICKSGPDRNNVYLNYYATLAVHHVGGDLWEEWNPVMRSHLVNTQILNGNAAGSWPVTDPHGMPAGQIYQTCLSTLCLEVYYRYLPMYETVE